MTIWYAQNASTNIDAEGQWNDAPDGSGTALTWASLGATDVLCANGKANIYVTGSLTCARITTSGGGIGAGGGQFYVQTGVRTYTLTCNVVAGTTACLRIDNGGGTITVIGDVTGGSAGNAYGIYKFTGAGAVSIEGALTGGSALQTMGLYVQAAGSTVLVTGSATGGTGAWSHGIELGAAAIVTLNGNATGGTYTNTGNMVAGVCNNRASGVLTVNGTVSAGTGIAAPGAYGNLGAITVIGSLVDSATCPAYIGMLNWQPWPGVHYHKVFYDADTPNYYTYPPAQTDVRDGVHAGFSDLGVAYNGTVVIPSEGDVRLGVDFDYPGKETGTLKLPAEADVKDGVLYGASGSEFEGDLIAGGGAMPLVGLGGLVA